MWWDIETEAYYLRRREVKRYICFMLTLSLISTPIACRDACGNRAHPDRDLRLFY